MFSPSLLVTLAILPFVAAQSPNTALQIEAIEAHFAQSHVVPDLLSSFNPSALLALNFAGVGDITPGQGLRKEQAAPAPTVNVTPANSSVTLSGTYTLTMVDADIVGFDLSQGETRHWLVNNVTVTDGKISNATAVAITNYAGPGPAAGSGPHRYVVLLYQQPANFTPPAEFSQPIGVEKFDLNAYAKNSNLGPIIAGSYFTVEEGQATVSVSPTSAVVSSTLAPVSSAQPSGSKTSGAASTQTGNSDTNNAIKTGVFSLIGTIMTGLLVFILV